jgi:hypothetical protein
MMETTLICGACDGELDEHEAVDYKHRDHLKELTCMAAWPCQHRDQDKPPSYYGTSETPDETDWNFRYCPKCGEKLTGNN